jgi:hypothetical protein
MSGSLRSVPGRRIGGRHEGAGSRARRDRGGLRGRGRDRRPPPRLAAGRPRACRRPGRGGAGGRGRVPPRGPRGELGLFPCRFAGRRAAGGSARLGTIGGAASPSSRDREPRPRCRGLDFLRHDLRGARLPAAARGERGPARGPPAGPGPRTRDRPRGRPRLSDAARARAHGFDAAAARRTPADRRRARLGFGLTDGFRARGERPSPAPTRRTTGSRGCRRARPAGSRCESVRRGGS